MVLGQTRESKAIMNIFKALEAGNGKATLPEKKSVYWEMCFMRESVI